jgi:hypothetical protein
MKMDIVIGRSGMTTTNRTTNRAARNLGRLMSLGYFSDIAHGTGSPQLAGSFQAISACPALCSVLDGHEQVTKGVL